MVPDPYMARALASQLGPEYPVRDLFAWASETLPGQKPNPLELFQVFDEVLAAQKIELSQESIPFRWQLAQLFARDWEEVLLGTLSLQEAFRYWDDLSRHQQIARLFSLPSDPPAWLQHVPLPIKSPKNLKTFWEKFKDFREGYFGLLRRKGLHFNEEALQELVSRNRLEEGLFLHLYSAYPLLEAIAGRAPHKTGWKVDSLAGALPEVWKDFPSPSEAWPFPSRGPRKVSLHTGSVLTLLLQEAARAIATWLDKASPHTWAALWCSPDSEPLLRHFLQKEGVPAEVLSPQALTLWEGTDIGRFLRTYLLEGLEGRLHTWPEPPSSPENASSAAETWARRLYDIVREGQARDPLHWSFLARLFQERIAGLDPFPASVRLYMGQLMQLAGGQYEVLFLVDPPTEPLGPWARPSFWMASLRKQFYSPAQHHRLAWRLQSVLLWASQEVRIFRLADPGRIPPVEELLFYGEALGLSGEFCSPGETSPASPRQVPVSRPLEEPPQDTFGSSFSPSRVSALFRCPRRFYWQSVLPEEQGPVRKELFIGRLMHELMRLVIAPKAPPGEAVETTLAKLAYRSSRRRLFYRAVRLLSREERRLLARTHSYRLLVPLIAETGQSLLALLVKLLLDEEHPLRVRAQAGLPLRWRHFQPVAILRYRFYVERPLLSPTSQLPVGRMDLLVEEIGSCPDSRRFLVDFKQRLPRETKPDRALDGLDAVLEALQKGDPIKPPTHYEEALFQLFTYAWYLAQSGTKVNGLALVSLWWRPRRKALRPIENVEAKHMVVFELEPHLEDVLQHLWGKLPSVLSGRKGPVDFPQTPDKETCRYCDFALLCDRLRV